MPIFPQQNARDKINCKRNMNAHHWPLEIKKRRGLTWKDQPTLMWYSVHAQRDFNKNVDHAVALWKASYYAILARGKQLTELLKVSQHHTSSLKPGMALRDTELWSTVDRFQTVVSGQNFTTALTCANRCGSHHCLNLTNLPILIHTRWTEHSLNVGSATMFLANVGSRMNGCTWL